MAGPTIQVLPSGLLGFLQLKNGGQFPQRLGDTLQPTIELAEWYVQLNSETLFSAVINAPVNASSSGNTFPELVVPNGQVWFVHEYIVGFGPSATGTATKCAGVMNRISVNGPTTAAYVTDPLDIATVGQRVFARMGQRVILPPGSSMGFVIGPVITALIPVQGTATFSRCLL
jgi:hypothetical protein